MKQYDTIIQHLVAARDAGTPDERETALRKLQACVSEELRNTRNPVRRRGRGRHGWDGNKIAWWDKR